MRTAYPYHASGKESRLVYRVHFPDVMSSDELGNISLHELRRYAMISFVVSTLQYRPETLNSVSLGLFTDIFAHALIYAFMLERKPDIASVVVSVTHRLLRYVLSDKTLYCLCSPSLNGLGNDLVCIPILHGDDNGFPRTASSMASLALVLVSLFTAYEGFVHFYSSVQQWLTASPSRSYLLRHHPNTLLSYAKVFMQFHA